MEDQDKTKEQLISELALLRERVTRLEAADVKLRETQESLAEREHMMRSISVSSPVGIVYSRGRRIQWANRAWEEMFGFGDKQEYLDHPTSIMHSSSLEYERVRSVLYDNVNSHGLSETHAVFRRKDGSVFHAHIRMSLLDTEDPASGVISTITDISKLRAAEHAVRDSEKKFRLLVERVRDGIVVAQEGMLCFVNPSAMEILGYDADELSSRPFTEFIYPDDREMVLQRHFQRLKGEDILSRYSFRIIRKDGSIGWVEIDSGMIDWEGRPAALFCITDITERKKKEEALRESETRYRALVDNMGNAVAVYRAVGEAEDFIFVDFNRAGQKIEKISKDQVIGRRVTEVFAGVAEFGLLEVFRRVWRTGEPESHPVKFYKDERIDGWRENYVYRLPSGELVAVYSDETERKKAEFDLEASEQMLRSILSTCPVGISMAQDRVIKWVNDSWVKMFGFESQQECISLSARSLFLSQKEFERVGNELYRPLENGAITETETKLARKDGSIFDAYVRMQRIGTAGFEEVVVAATTDVSDRKRQQAELAELNAKLTTILESISDAFLVLDKDMVVTYFNQAAERLLGKSRQQVLGRKLFEVFPEALGSVFEEQYTMALREKTPLAFETYFEVPPYVNWYDVRVYPFEEGISIYFQITTERKLIEKKLIESESRFQAFMEHAPIVAFIKDEYGRFVYANNKWLNFMDLVHGDWLGKTSEQVFPQEVAVKLLEADSVALEQNRPIDYTLPLKKSDGSLSYWLTFKFPLETTEGRRLLGGVAIDITDRKKLEEELRERTEELKTLLDAQPAFVLFAHDPECRVITGNQTANEVLGVPADTNVSLTAKQKPEGILIKRVRPDGTEYRPDELPLQRAAATGKPVFDREIEYRFSDGRQMFIRGNAVPLFDAKGGVRGSIAVFLDVTRLKESEREREALREQLLQSQKMEAIGTLAAGIAHDFNNMLQVIVGYADLLLLNKKPGDPGYVQLQKIIKTAYDARDLVQKIRLISRRADIKRKPLELNLHVKEASELLAQTLPRNIIIEMHLTENLATINADSGLMTQMVMNLGINAGEAMPEGGTLNISTENTVLEADFCLNRPGLEPGPHVLLTVSDTGRGIPPEVMDRIFDPFYSTKVRDYHKGTGLGLPVVRGIVEMHKGCMDVESELGRGTTVRIYLPIMEVIESSKKVEDIEQPLGGTETILLVEDEEMVRNLEVHALEQSGYTVLAAVDGQEALQVYEREKDSISLVILDIIMPRMDGKQCFKELLMMNPNLKVLISSGVIQRELIQEVVNLGAKGSLVKPFNVMDLLRKVRELIDSD